MVKVSFRVGVFVEGDIRNNTANFGILVFTSVYSVVCGYGLEFGSEV